MLSDFGGHAFLNKVANYYGPLVLTPGVNLNDGVKYIINDNRIYKCLPKDANAADKSQLLELILNELEKAQIQKVNSIGLLRKYW